MFTPLELAIASYNTQLQISPKDHCSIRSIALEFDVQRSTLQNRVYGSKPRHEGHGAAQKLTDGEEDALVQ